MVADLRYTPGIVCHKDEELKQRKLEAEQAAALKTTQDLALATGLAAVNTRLVRLCVCVCRCISAWHAFLPKYLDLSVRNHTQDRTRTRARAHTHTHTRARTQTHMAGIGPTQKA